MSIREETRRDRLNLTREAGISRISFLAVVAGTLVAFGAFAVVAAIVSAVLSAVGVDNDFAENNWETIGGVGAGVLALVVLLSYLFGGYVAGRTARRSGIMHGFLVFVLGLLVAAIIGGAVAGLADTDQLTEDVRSNLRSVGLPTSGDEWGEIGTVAGIATLVAMLVGALLGGMWGERWHTKLTRRAVDPSYGPEADARRHAVDDERRAAGSRRQAGVDLGSRDEGAAGQERGRPQDTAPPPPPPPPADQPTVADRPRTER